MPSENKFGAILRFNVYSCSPLPNYGNLNNRTYITANIGFTRAKFAEVNREHIIRKNYDEMVNAGVLIPSDK